MGLTYGDNPGAGGTRGAIARKTLERKKNVTTGHVARKGGDQSYFFLDQGVYRYSRLNEIKAFTIANGYDTTVRTEKALVQVHQKRSFQRVTYGSI